MNWTSISTLYMNVIQKQNDCFDNPLNECFLQDVKHNKDFRTKLVEKYKKIYKEFFKFNKEDDIKNITPEPSRDDVELKTTNLAYLTRFVEFHKLISQMKHNELKVKHIVFM